MKRYKVVKESATGHCCFEASVVDQLRPFIGGDDKIHWDLSAASVCECLDSEMAEKIASLLNANEAMPDVETVASSIFKYEHLIDWEDLPESEVTRVPRDRMDDLEIPPRKYWRGLADQAISKLSD
jgi:hypothetical protein